MILPNPSMDFTPFDVLTAAELDDLVENDQAIATGLNDGTALTSIRKNNLTIDSNPYKFRARRVAALTPSGSTFTKIVFDTEDFDTNNNFATGTYTAPVAGFYFFNGYFNVASTTIIISLYKNGSLYQRGGQFASAGGATGTFFVQSAASDTWEMWLWEATSTAVDVTAGNQPFFEGFLVCRT